MDNSKTGYRSFMLRLWTEQANGNNWRFSLEDTQTGKRRGFASQEKLIKYLEEMTNELWISSNEKNEL